MTITRFTKDNIKQVFALSDQAFEGLSIYHKLLIKWQKAINLVSNKTLNEAWHRHFADSAQLSRLLPFDEGKIYVDLGCGGGFPGLVIAVMRPEMKVHLVESDERKGQFMRSVIREIGLENAYVHTCRIEDVTRNGEFLPDYVSARALASLSKLLAYCKPWIEANPALSFYFLKGEHFAEEIDVAREKYDFIARSVPSVTDELSQIILLENVCVV